jgi:hypothetical protein
MNTHRNSGRLGCDTVFELLADGQRRRLLVALLDVDENGSGPVPVNALIDGQDPDRRRVRMTHGHLPKLADADVIDWDDDADVVTRGSAFEELRPLLALIDEHAERVPDCWPR